MSGIGGIWVQLSPSRSLPARFLPTFIIMLSWRPRPPTMRIGLPMGLWSPTNTQVPCCLKKKGTQADMHWSRMKAAIAGCMGRRSEEHTSELQSLMRISTDVSCLTITKQADTKHHYDT